MNSDIAIRDMKPEDEEFVSLCGHNQDEAKDHPVFIADCIEFSVHRKEWFNAKYDLGFRAKVALFEDERAGFLYIMPIEICPWGPIGEDLLVIPCLNVNETYKEKGIGGALLEEAEKEVTKQGKKGIVLIAYHWGNDFWFMPASFFEKQGYLEIRRKDLSNNYIEVMLWKKMDQTAKKPDFMLRNYSYQPIPQKVVIDLFFNTFCETSNTEAGRVREVAQEYGDKVILREFSADDRKQLLTHQISRGIFVNGKEISWGYEAPRKGVKEAIMNALNQI
ncbi:MAG: GNAT family N-acetyltransferase [Candidatus Thorarchaeota archaeon]